MIENLISFVTENWVAIVAVVNSLVLVIKGISNLIAKWKATH